MRKKFGKNIPCKQCGKIIYRKPHQIKDNKNNFCCLRCKSKFYAYYLKYKTKEWVINNALAKVGKPRSDECKKRISMARIGKYCLEKHPNWKGENVGYAGIHDRIRKIKGRPNKCSRCGKKTGKLEWANIDHKYSTNPDDYISMCTSCHRNYDYKVNKKQCLKNQQRLN